MTTSNKQYIQALRSELEPMLAEMLEDFAGAYCFVTSNIEQSNFWFIHSIARRTNEGITILKQDKPHRIKTNVILSNAMKYPIISSMVAINDKPSHINLEPDEHDTRMKVLSAFMLESEAKTILSFPVKTTPQMSTIVWIIDPNDITKKLSPYVHHIANIFMRYYIAYKIYSNSRIIETTCEVIGKKVDDSLKILDIDSRGKSSVTNNNIISDHLINIASFVSDLKDIYKLRTGRTKIARSSVNVDYAITSAINTIKNEYPRVEFKHLLESNVPKNIYADALKLKLILVTLLTNACHNLEECKSPQIMVEVSSDIIVDGEENSDISSEASYSVDKYEIIFRVTDNGETNNAIIGKFAAPDTIYDNLEAHDIKLLIAKKLANFMNGDLIFQQSLTGQNISTLSLITFNDETCAKNPIDSIKLLNGKMVLVIHSNVQTRIKICNILKKYQILYTSASAINEATSLYLDSSSTKFQLIICEDSSNISIQPLVDFMQLKHEQIPYIAISDRAIVNNPNKPAIDAKVNEEDLIMAIYNAVNN